MPEEVRYAKRAWFRIRDKSELDHTDNFDIEVEVEDNDIGDGTHLHTHPFIPNMDGDVNPPNAMPL